MRITRSLKFSLAAVAVALPCAVVPQTASAAATHHAAPSSWIITVKTATFPTLQAERDRVMHDAQKAGMKAEVVCLKDERGCNEAFVVTNTTYRTILSRFRYDAAIVSVEAN